MSFHLDFANNTILLCFFFIFSIIDLYFLIAAVITPIFNPTTELIISIGIPTTEAETETETHSVIEEAKIRKSSI